MRIYLTGAVLLLIAATAASALSLVSMSQATKSGPTASYGHTMLQR